MTDADSSLMNIKLLQGEIFLIKEKLEVHKKGILNLSQMELQIKAIKESQSQYAEVRDLDLIKDDMSRCVDKMSFSILEGKVETKVE